MYSISTPTDVGTSRSSCGARDPHRVAVRAKFDVHVDPLQLGAQFLKVRELADLPRMRIALPEDEWRSFFVAAARGLGPSVLAA